jgi:lysozyme family protein
MAKIELLVPKILKWEGGYVNDPLDAGGATNKGVTLATWRHVGHDKDGDGDIDAADIKLLSVEDATMVLKKFFWDKWHADDIKSQAVAEILVDWVWGSGVWGIKIPQRILGVAQDGNVGPLTLKRVNEYPNQQELFNKIKQARIEFIDGIIKRKPSQVRFEKGWKNRINSYTFY